MFGFALAADHAAQLADGAPAPRISTVVERLVPSPAARVVAALRDPATAPSVVRIDIGGTGRLELDGAAARGDHTWWRARGRLHGRGRRLVRFARVEVEVAPATHGTALLSIRPVCRHSQRWGARRLTRYFADVHDAVDELRRLLVARSTAPDARVDLGADAVLDRAA